MSAMRWFTGLLAACFVSGAVLAGGMPPLNAEDFAKRAYRGFTLDRPLSRPAEDFDDLAALGVNLVRVWVHLERCDECTAYTVRPGDVEEVDRVVRLAEDRRIYVILTMAPEPPVNAAYWKSAALQDSIVAIWSELAERYKGHSAMGGFDLINEPNPPGKAGEAHRQYAKFAGRLIQAVRKVDPQRMIVYEPAPRGNTFYAFKEMKTPLPYGNVLYSPHFYKPVDVTHQGVGGMSYGHAYPTWLWDKARLSKELEQVRAFAKRHNLPIYVGEFGSVRNAPDGASYRWIKDVVDLFETEGWSWTFHAFRGFHGWDHELPAMAPKPSTPEAAMAQRRPDTPVFGLLREQFMKNKTGLQVEAGLEQ